MTKSKSTPTVVGVAAALVALAISTVSATTPGALRTASTPNSIGLEWDVTGDDDLNATATVRYRVAGSPDWSAGFDPLRVRYGGRDMLAGSLMFLAPETAYEIELSMSDPDGTTASRNVTVTTAAFPRVPDGGRTLHAVPGTGGGSGTEADPYRGMATAWAAAEPGDVVRLHAGSYGAVRDADGRSGQPGRPIVFRAHGDGEVTVESLELFRHSHLWFEGLTFRRGTSDTAVFASLLNPGYDTGFQPMPVEITDVTLTRNTFYGFKHSIRAGPRTRRWYVLDNTMVGDRTLGMSGTESYDGEGVELGRGSDHVVAYNSITMHADAISFPRANCDIFGNDIFDVTDDGIELDHGEANVRAWGNRIHNAGHNGIAFQPMAGAPWYIVRNQVVNFQESAFKFRTTDRFVAVHNTFVNWGDVLNHWAEHLLRGTTRNNLWISVADGKIWRRAYASADRRTDLDYDGFDWGSNPAPFMYEGVEYPDLASLTAASGLLPHGIRIDQDTCFETFDVPGPPPLTTIPPQWMTLAAGCAAVDAGEPVANLGGTYTGAAPDLGAFERGATLPHYGPRPLDDTAPPAPTDVVADPVAHDRIDVSWTAPTDPESGIDRFEVLRDDVVAGTTIASPWADVGLAEQATHTYRVVAINGAGLRSPPSDPSTATTPADTDPPDLLEASAGGDAYRVDVAFSEPVERSSAETASNYALDGGVAVTSATLTEDPTRVRLTVSGLADGVTYVLTVSGVRDRAARPNTIAPGSTASFTYSAIRVPEGRVAHWTFDEGTGTVARDASGRGRDATLVGAGWTSGVLGGAVSFDGVDDRVDAGAFDVDGTALSISLWLWADDFDPVDARLVSKATSTAEQDHLWMLSTIGGPSLRFRLRTEGATSTLVGASGTLTPGRWIHAAATYDGAAMRLYQDGVEVGVLAKSGPVATDPAVPVHLGRNPDGYGPWQGRLDDVRIYDRALTAEEVAALAADSGPPSGNPPPPPTGLRVRVP